MSAAENKAIFLSYASQDAPAVERLAEALRAAGVEVWFDKNELTGGDAWDQKIRRQIKECALFVPVISAATNARREGYFRREWKLAVDRTHDMDEALPFLLPVVIDATTDAGAFVPEKFREVQWTRLPGGETPEKFCARVKTLLGGETVPTGSAVGARLVRAQEDGRGQATPLQKPSRSWSVPAIIGVGLLIAVAAFFALRPRRSPEEIAKLIASAQTVAANAAAKSAPAAPASPTTPAPAITNTFPRDPELRRAWTLVFNALNAEDFALAEEIVKAAVARHSTDAETVIVYAWLNDTYLNRGFDVSEERYVLGKRYAERAVQLAPNDPEALAALGQFLTFRGADLARAEQLLNRAIELNPREPRFYRAMSYNVLREARPAEFLPYAERTAQLFPDNALVLYELGLAYRDAGRLDEMERAFDRCLAVAPIAGAIIWKSWFAGWVHGDVVGMKDWLDRLPAEARQTDRALISRYQHACVTRQPGELADALRALQAFPGTTLRDFYYTGPKALPIGDLYAAQGKRELAKGQYEVALAEIAREKISAPDDFNVLTAELWTLIGLGRREQAAATLRLLISSASDFRPRFVRWWFDPMPACLLVGAGDLALQQFKAYTGSEALRSELRTAFRLDPRMAPFRDDPGIAALIAEPKKETAVLAPKADLSAPADKSVAVLAFADLSAARDSEYFSDGISEELLNVLAKVQGLKVTARTSAFFFKGKNLPIPEIAQKLGVAYVIEGSVQRAGERVKITAQLIKAADGFHVWSDTFTRDAKDVFAVEEEIAGLIAKQLSLKLGVSSAASTASVNPQAFELYVQARQQWNLRTTDSFNRAEDMLNRALALEPNFARAHAALGDVWNNRAQVDGTIGAFGDRNSPELARIRAKAREALALDPNSAEAHALLGSVLTSAWQKDEAEHELRLAIALNPAYATGHQRLCRVLSNDGRNDEGLAELKLAAELDPLSPIIVGNYARVLRWNGRYTESLTVTERAIALQPEGVAVLISKGRTLLALGRAGEAAAVVRGLTADSDSDVVAMVGVLAGMGRRAEAEAQLARVKDGSWRWFGLAALGRRADSVAAFDAQRLSVIQFTDFLFDSSCDLVRDDPRIVQGLAALGLTEAHARVQAWRKAHPPEKPAAK